ncbi:Transposable element Tc1 transposase [Labeo rohita]|uniref:Transposable element Tc1 transposase n=1 Tax=Labeo rohita TaxID=84645 RepID=A0ABQ8M7J5_LABRO|nr:Transposable element Tc1 transposase [Labeo rohita]
MVSQFGSLGYTIMGKTVDLTVVQKTIIDTLHKEGKPQTFTAKEGGCTQSAEWTEAGVKASRATTHKRVNEFGNSCRIPRVKPLLNHRRRQRRLTWAKEKKKWTVDQWSKVLFSDESKFSNIENLWGIVKRKMRNKRPNNADELKATVKETGLPYHLSSATD